MEFNPKIAELIQTGATAALLLDAQRQLCGELVEMTLREVDRAIDNDLMTPNLALGLVHELSAYRRIVRRQQQQVDRGQRAKETAQ